MTTDQLIYLIVGGAGLGLFVAACGSWYFLDRPWHQEPPGPDPDPGPGPEQARQDAALARDQAMADAEAIREQGRQDAEAITEQARKDAEAIKEKARKDAVLARLAEKARRQRRQL